MVNQDFELAAELDGVMEAAQSDIQALTAQLARVTTGLKTLEDNDETQTKFCRQMSNR